MKLLCLLLAAAAFYVHYLTQVTTSAMSSLLTIEGTYAQIADGSLSTKHSQ